MARPPRLDFPGAWHHVLNRGRRREPTFADDGDCTLFLEVLEATVERFGVQVHAYALMPNHYHLLLRSVRGNLSRAMGHLGGVYTQRANERHGWDGPMFRGRFRSQLIDDETHLRHLLAYLHLNPVAAHLVSRPDEPSWTSHRTYLGLEPVPPFLCTAPLLDDLGGPAGVETFVREVHCGSRPWPEAMDTATGLLVGGDASRFPPRLEPVEPVVLDPERIEQLVCRITGASATDLRTPVRGPRANPARRFAVWAMREGATLPYSAIGSRLGMTTGHVAKVLRRFLRGGQPFRQWVDRWYLEVADLDA